MRTVLLVAVATALLLAGCGTPTPSPTPTQAADEPVFASDEEALAAAAAVLDKYIVATNAVGTSGGTDMSGFDGIVAEAQRADEVVEAESLKSEGRKLQGSYAYFDLRVQQLDQSNPPEAFLQVYLCLDLTNVRYVDSEGKDLSAESPALASPVEVMFTNAPDHSTTLLIDDVRRWTGEDFCA